MSAENNHGINPSLSSQAAEEELAEVYSRQRPLLIGIARKRGRKMDAEDVAQDGAIQALLSIRSGNYEERGKLSAYLSVIVKNQAINASRIRTINSLPLTDISEFYVKGASEENHPEKAAMVREDITAVMEAVSQLSPRQRDVLVLWSQGLTHQEISSQLDINPKNSKVFLSKARKRLKSLL